MSEKQLIANRANAQLSTGPRTPEGKARSSQNALKHGLYAKAIIIESPDFKEDPEEYQALVDSLYDELQPESAFQEHLVRRIANCLWRSQRAIRAETAFVNRELEKVDAGMGHREFWRDIRAKDADMELVPETEAEIAKARQDMIGTLLLPAENDRVRILHYEMRLDRQLTRAYRLLRELKAKGAKEM